MLISLSGIVEGLKKEVLSSNPDHQSNTNLDEVQKGSVIRPLDYLGNIFFLITIIYPAVFRCLLRELLQYQSLYLDLA